MANALLLEDDPAHRTAMQHLLGAAGFEVVATETIAAAETELRARSFDLVLSDLRLPDGEALALLPLLDESAHTELVIVTGRASVDTAVDAFRGGAIDYLTKPVDMSRLKKILARVRQTARLQAQVADLREQLRGLGRFGRLVGSSKPMQEVYDRILKVAPTEATVLISGETGTGKELVAQSVHELSGRAERPYVVVNCGAIAPTLIESELFGHERGSFTGAEKRHVGVFEQADGGTLFLDEVTEMPIELQVKLLRALENRQIVRIGGSAPIDVDVRVLAATNRDPKKAVDAGKLREDLLYRLLVFPIQVAPLRARGADVELLAQTFLDAQNQRAGTRKVLTRAAVERLRLHDWPGNVRELRHAVEHAFILAEDYVGPECFPMHHTASGEEGAGSADLGIRVGTSAEDAQRILTLATLDHFGEKKKTAEVLGVSLKTLYNWLKRYETESDPALDR